MHSPNLPAPVTFALTPYGADLEKLAERARAEEHEVLLQVPMEPFDYPDNDPGPQTLLTSLSSEQNIDRLHWLMSRFQGYVGIMSFMGTRFTASEQAIAPVLRDAAKRGLIFVDDGSSSRSVAGQLAGGHNLPFAKADIVLDTVPTSGEIDRALARLEMKAREGGTAVGFATAQPATDRAHCRMGEKSRSPRLPAGADQHGGDQGEVIVTLFLIAITATEMTEHECLPRFPALSPLRRHDGAQPAPRATFSLAGVQRGPNTFDATHVWQMPQGGIDENEDPYKAGRCASCTRRPISAPYKSSARSPNG